MPPPSHSERVVGRPPWAAAGPPAGFLASGNCAFARSVNPAPRPSHRSIQQGSHTSQNLLDDLRRQRLHPARSSLLVVQDTDLVAQHHALRDRAAARQRDSEAMFSSELAALGNWADKDQSEPIEVGGRENQDESFAALLVALSGIEIDVENIAAVGYAPLHSSSLPTGPLPSQARSFGLGARSDGRQRDRSSARV